MQPSIEPSHSCDYINHLLINSSALLCWRLDLLYSHHSSSRLKSQIQKVGSHLTESCNALVTCSSAFSRMRFSTCYGDRGFTLFTACCPRQMPSRLWVDPSLKEENVRLKGSPEKCSWMFLCSVLSCVVPSCSMRFESTGKVSQQRADLKEQSRFGSKASISALGTQLLHRLPRPHGVLRVPSTLRCAGTAPHEEAREELHCEGREEGKSVSKTGKKCAALPVPVPAAKINAVRRQLHYIWPWFVSSHLTEK